MTSTTRINILHVSDLHYEKDRAHDIRVVGEAFLEDLKQVCDSPLKPNLFVFSGDVANAGDDNDAFYRVLEHVIMPAAEATGTTETIFFTAGNHDARREFVELHRSVQCEIRSASDRESVNILGQSDRISEFVNEKFSNYNVLTSVAASQFITNESPFYTTAYIPSLDIAIASLNTSWATNCGIGEDDVSRLLVSERHMTEAIDALPKAAKKLLITHHPIEWLSEIVRSDFGILAERNFDVHLFGHVHSPRPISRRSPDGTIFTNQSGALFTTRRRLNGYSVVSLDPGSPHVQSSFRTYFDDNRRFGAGENIAPGGRFHSSSDSERHWKAAPSALVGDDFLDWLQGPVRAELELAFNDGLAAKPLSQVFVEPPLSSLSDVATDEDDADQAVAMNDMVRSGENYVVTGNREFGKTTLLQQFALRALQLARELESPRLPCMINFQDIRPGRDRMVRLLRAQLPADMPEGMSLDVLLAAGRVFVVVDDVDLSRDRAYKTLTDFMSEYPRNRYLIAATTKHVNDVLGSVEQMPAPLPFRRIFLRPLSRNKLRLLVEKWGLPLEVDKDRLLSRMVADLVHINVPMTAVSGTILLTIFDEYNNGSPISRTVLIEQFVNALLDKWCPDEARLRSYDFRFKTSFLSSFAENMVRNDNYVVPYEDALSFTRRYFERLALRQEPNEWLEQFVSAKILVNRGFSLSFRYRAFLEYFVAQQMDEQQEFRAFVVAEERYLSFLNEIEYYAGRKRGDIDLTNEIGDRFARLSDAMWAELDWKPDVSRFESMRRPKHVAADVIYKRIDDEMKLPGLTSEERDRELEAEIPRDVGRRQEVFRPLYTDVGQRWTAALILYSKMIRNSELIPGDSKRAHLRSVLDGWSAFSAITLTAIPTLVKHRSIVINGVRHLVIMPKSMTDEEVAEEIYMGLPRNISRPIAKVLGSEKLEGLLSEPLMIQGENEEPAMVAFYRASLYADLRLPNFVGVLQKLDRRLRRAQYLREAALWKMRELFRSTGLGRDDEGALRGLISETAAHLFAPSGKDQEREMARQAGRLKRARLVRSLRERNKSGREREEGDA